MCVDKKQCEREQEVGQGEEKRLRGKKGRREKFTYLPLIVVIWQQMCETT